MSRTSEVSKQLLLLESCEDFQEQTVQICSSAQRQLDILSHCLDFPVYNHPATIKAISKMARSHRLARVRLLVRETQPLIERGHGLVRLAQRLPTKIELRKLVVEPENANMGFLLCDREQLLYKNDDNEYRGFIDRQAGPDVQALREIFTRSWDCAIAEPKLRLLYL